MVFKKRVEGNKREHFTIHPIGDDIIAFESNNFPGYYLKSHSLTGKNQLQMAKSNQPKIKAMKNDPWAWFKMIPVDDGIFALESVKFPGNYL